jgi:hypothetical protein
MFVFFGKQDHVIGSRLRHILLIEKSVYRSQNFLGAILPSNHYVQI